MERSARRKPPSRRWKQASSISVVLICWVNNAGIFIPKAFSASTEEDYNLVTNTNVASFFYMSQQVIPQMKKQNSGHVVNISAVLADQPSGAAPALLAVLSKSPMPAVSKALALEYAANNIRFNTVSPRQHQHADARQG